MAAMTSSFAGKALARVANASKGQAKMSASDYYGPSRPKWLGPYSEGACPAYLDGTYPGDYGYDTMRLSADPERFAVYREQELLHARFAMLGLVGVVIPEAFPQIGSTWFEVGASIFSDDGLNYLGNSSAIHAQSILAVVFTQVFFMGLIESYRVNGGPAGDGLDSLHPGGPFFDPFGLADDPETFAELKVKEIKNGRLAMFAMLGVYVQALYTQQGPVANWKAHIAAPFEANGFAYGATAYCAADPVNTLCG